MPDVDAMLIVTSLEGAEEAFRRRHPARVISLVSEDEILPCFEGLDESAHLKLYVHDESSAKSITGAAKSRAAAVLKFLDGWTGEEDLLIHCRRGVSRSTAAAFIALCVARPDADEADLLARLRRAAPHADPCPLMVSNADAALGRNGRMTEALDELAPPAAAPMAAPTAEISVD
jgi:predicted protein tyrosine phosphatase